MGRLTSSSPAGWLDTESSVLGLRLWLAGYLEQAFPGHPPYYSSSLGGPSSRLFWVCLIMVRSCALLTAVSAYPVASLGYANWILRHYGYKTVFIFGLTLYGIGALCMWPAGLNRSFGGFCGATFVIGSGLGSLETAANPYLTGELEHHPGPTSIPPEREDWL